ncbi:unnamed protein product [Lactuca saligna]|uniref:Uncharacterized protein n=1 Tax=Lactuca saligna TaxID=75948 RepID=A0AA35YCT9_LACSI|nr:unnamed protein product [Lactuca saligna]
MPLLSRGLETFLVGEENWQEKLLWVNNDLVVLIYPIDKVYVDCAPTLFGADKELVDALEKININGENWIDFFLPASGMSVAWWVAGKCPSFSLGKRVLMGFDHSNTPMLYMQP